MSIKIIITSDGSHSLLNETLDETYHSRHGAIQESNHVFIKNGLDYCCGTKTSLSILEVGFGTGLNAMLTLAYGLAHNKGFKYTALEPFPLEEDIWSQLNYAETLNLSAEFKKLHMASWNVDEFINPYFELSKHRNTLEDVPLANEIFDLVYYDAFAPSKQPVLWDLGQLEKTARAMAIGGTFVTYCAKGQLKRDLKSLGLHVETLPGPPGKKEMVRAIKL